MGENMAGWKTLGLILVYISCFGCRGDSKSEHDGEALGVDGRFPDIAEDAARKLDLPVVLDRVSVDVKKDVKDVKDDSHEVDTVVDVEIEDSVAELETEGQEVTEEVDICAPDCEGKNCGDDGCGGSCGGCPPANLELCLQFGCENESGQCVEEVVECDDSNKCTDDACEINVDSGLIECVHTGNAKPLILLIIDTSASMEWSSTVEVEGQLPMCNQEYNPGYEYDKSRWAVVLEALTGTFKNYWCSYDDRLGDPEAEDYNAQPNHVAPQSATDDVDIQEDNGILDELGASVRFALMTFDPKSGIELDATGGFSYGPDKEAFGNTTNWGAKNEQAPWGALVPPATQDSSELLQTVAGSIQAQLLGARPFNGTPIGPALEDALFFVQTDDSVGPYDADTGAGDAKWECRGKHVVLLTDGQPNLPYIQGTLGYMTSPEAAAALLAENLKVHVIAFQQPEGSLEWLSSIAEAGGTENPVVITEPDLLRPALEALVQEVTANK
jgi:hypothetical protein